MKQPLKTFWTRDSGAVTVDWVVLTAAVTGIGLMAVTSVYRGSEGLMATVSAHIGSMTSGGSGSGYQFVAMTDSGHWWNNTELRREQMAEMTDGRLLHEWDHYAVGYFRSAVERGDNSICDNCRGAGNRLDLMHIVLSEMETRGLATDDHRSTMRDSIQTYQTHFSE